MECGLLAAALLSMGWVLWRGWEESACLLDDGVAAKQGWGDVEGLGQQAAPFDMRGSWADLDESGGKPSALQKTLQEVGALGGAGGEDFGGDFGLGEIALVHRGGDFVGFVFAAKGDRGTSEAASGHAAAEDATVNANLFRDLTMRSSSGQETLKSSRRESWESFMSLPMSA